jgi:hypothetical protein
MLENMVFNVIVGFKLIHTNTTGLMTLFIDVMGSM